MLPSHSSSTRIWTGILVGLLQTGELSSQEEAPGAPKIPPAAALTPVQAQATAKNELEKLTGTWLFESAFMGDRSLLTECWTSELIIRGNVFKLARFMGVQKDLNGTLVVDPGEKPKKIDLKVLELDLAEFNIPLKIPAGKLEGIYQLDGDRLQLCIAMSSDQLRPATFQTIRLQSVLLQFGRIDPARKNTGKDWKAQAIDAEGKPVKGAKIFPFMTKRDKAAGQPDGPDWHYTNALETGADGTVTFPSDLLKNGILCARDLQKHTIGYGQDSPAAEHKGMVTIPLQPETKVQGTIASEEMRKLSKPLGLTYAYLEKNGVRVASNVSAEGKYEFFVPPGNYSIFATGPNLQSKSVKLLVLPETTEVAPDPIDLSAQRTVYLQGDPAPELKSIVGWKGEPVRIADCKGKYVLLAFWGYWDGPSIDSLPVLIDIQNKYNAKNLMVIGVHIDAFGEITNAAKFDQRTNPFKAAKWGNREIPFPVALASGKQFDEYKGDPVNGGPAALYGVSGFPSTVLIDPEGKIVSSFPGTDPIAAEARVQELLKKDEK